MIRSYKTRFIRRVTLQQFSWLVLAFALVAVVARAQSGLERPQLGWMLDANGTVRPVYGVAGATTLGDPAVAGALAIGCSAQLCLAKTDLSVIAVAGGPASGASVDAAGAAVNGAEVDAPPGPALFAIDGAAAWVYFPQVQQLARWQDGRLNPVDFAPDGEVLSLRSSPAAIDLAVRQNDGVWIERLSLADGSVSADGNISMLDALPRARGPVTLLRDGVMFATAHGVILRRTDGAEIRFDAAGVDAFFALGDGYVQARAGTTMWAVRTEAGRERLFLLPGVSK